MKKCVLYIAFLLFAFSGIITAQEKEVTNSLSLIEKGQADSAKIILSTLLKKYPSNSSVIYLDAVLTEDGSKAISKYQKVYDKYPTSKFADAALYKVYSYYYALGNYNKANSIMQQLKNNYPESNYLKASAAEPAETIKKEKVIYTHTIQAGAFIEKKNASSLSSDLKDDGYFTEIKEKSLGGTILHVVYAGRFTSEKDAAESLAKINKEFKLNGRIVLINNK